MHDEMKKTAAKKAAELIQDSMIIGLGTGSTAAYFVEALIQRVQQGLRIETTVSSSKHSEELARNGGLPITEIDNVSYIDITIDGADEIDRQKRMIKGGGGALFREKILASSSHEMWVIIDETKMSEQLGKHPLPVEIVPFGHKLTQKKIQGLSFQGEFRKQDFGKNFVTDNGNYVLDIHFSDRIENPEKMHEQLIQIPGVVETGFFFNLAKKVIVGKNNQATEIIN